MSQHAVKPWMFGKLPTNGDFVGRGLVARQRACLDQWLSAEMDSARTLLGARFEASYDTAAPWLFVCDDDAGTWQGGALCPSADSAGRRFPLMVALAGLAPAQAIDAARFVGGSLFDAFAQGYDADAFMAAIAMLRPGHGAEPAASEWWVEDEAGNMVERRDGSRPAGLLLTMLQGESV